MRIEIEVDWKTPVRQRAPDGGQRHPPRGSPESRLYWFALALHIEDQIDQGRMPSYAETSRQCGVSRARMSTLVSRIVHRGSPEENSVEDFQA
jgi:hypothetical protein